MIGEDLEVEGLDLSFERPSWWVVDAGRLRLRFGPMLPHPAPGAVRFRRTRWRVLLAAYHLDGSGLDLRDDILDDQENVALIESFLRQASAP